MTEEEAIKTLKNISTDDLLDCWDYGEEEYNAIQIILNLIEKQSKEIDELKSDNYELNNRINDLLDIENKIKNKIEEIKNINFNDYTRCQDGNEIKYEILLLFEELLEGDDE